MFLFGNGVDLFFVLSGFCLYYPLTKPGSTFRVYDFFRRRARRILPPYYAAMLVILALPFIIKPLAGAAGLVVFAPSAISWRQVWTHVFFVQTWFPDTFYGINGPFWTLGVEMQFYLAFPAAVWLVRRFGWQGIGLMALVTILYRTGVAMVAHQSIHGGYLAQGNRTLVVKVDFFLGRWLEFGMGMLAAMVVRRRLNHQVRRAYEVAALIGIVGLYAGADTYMLGPVDRWLLPISDIIYGVAFSGLLMLACAGGSLTGTVLGHPALVRIGIMSYSLYLIHYPVIMALGVPVKALGLGPAETMVVMTIVSAPLALACAAVFFHLFERPFLTAPARAPSPAPVAGTLMAKAS
jgi:peptidoglycan/LPS O-acetylase OafA/YrhL